MNRTIGIWLGTFLLASAGTALAQESAAGPGTVEITVMPAGGTFFMSKDSSPDFGNYTYGGAIAFNVNRILGFEAEVAGAPGIAQDLELAGGTSNLKTPNTVTYTGNVVVSAATGHSVVPYVTGGLGGLTMFRRAEVGVNDDGTFFTGNVGGGVKWYAPNGRWGIRGDYRLLAVQSKDDAPAFFGQDNRFGHRVSVGVVINAVR